MEATRRVRLRFVLSWACFSLILLVFLPYVQSDAAFVPVNVKNIPSAGRDAVQPKIPSLKDRPTDSVEPLKFVKPGPINTQFQSESASKPKLEVMPMGGTPVTSSPIKKPIKISKSEECAADVQMFCGNNAKLDNFAVLDCLQDNAKAASEVSEQCQHFIWQYKKDLTTDPRFDDAAGQVCKDSLMHMPDCHSQERATGQLISCMIEHKTNITSLSCKQFLMKMEKIVFSDYRLIFKFADACQGDIVKQSCGRIADEDDSPGSQGSTINCLSRNIKKLDDQCKHEILRVAELQSEDYHLDRPLFYACREDREKFCRNTPSGDGKVFKCLYRHKFEKGLSQGCRSRLIMRQKLMHEDYKVNKALSDACQQDIVEKQCLKNNDQHMFKEATMATILLCLESAIRDGDEVRPECVSELRDMRKTLLEDYEVSPNLVAACSTEIQNECQRMEKGGKTLHCLMDLARPKLTPDGELEDRISSECKAELKELLKQADVGENYALDPALHDACGSAAETLCADQTAGDGNVISCLTNHLGSQYMNDKCREHLMEIQYFIARDFRLDPRLYKFCRKDAVTFCHASAKWDNHGDYKPEQGPLVFSCLYRHLKLYSHDQSLQISRACQFEVRRVMHQRAVSVELEPRIERPCLRDLGSFCSDDDNLDKKGTDMQCLQDNFKRLSTECRWAVGNFTQDEDEDPLLDRLLRDACSPMIQHYCKELLKIDPEPGVVMRCLIENKYDEDMDPKCRAGVEHHQIITQEDFHLSLRFKEACKDDVARQCRGMKRKAEVVGCLSQVVRDDILKDAQSRISPECKQEVRFQLKQRGGNIKLDPKLDEACGGDVEQFCSNITPGQAKVIRCLRQHEKSLSEACHDKIFEREVSEAEDPNNDFLLMTACKQMIKRHCLNKLPTELFRCLRHHKEDEDFDEKCKKVVILRQRGKVKDIRLNPNLEKACNPDMKKFCSEVPTGNQNALEANYLTCLRARFARRMLSSTCTDYMSELIKEMALDYKLDVALASECKEEINQHCLHSKASDDEDGGDVEECLKERLRNRAIKDDKCIKQLLRVLYEDRVDVQVDPLLHKACSVDIQHYCHEVHRGAGRQMSCLIAALENDRVHLQKPCRDMLTNRVRMWEYAVKVAPPEGMYDLFEQITTSPVRHHFFAVFLTMIAIIFIFGLCCGRVTKRVKREMKNR